MLVSAALVLLMVPGLALFYGGMVRSKNVLGMLMQNLVLVVQNSTPSRVIGAATSSTQFFRQLHVRLVEHAA